MKIIREEVRLNCEVYMLEETNCIYLNHPDYRFVDVSVGSGENELLLMVTEEHDVNLENPFLVISISTDTKDIEALVSHPDKGTTLIAILDSQRVFSELDAVIHRN